MRWYPLGDAAVPIPAACSAECSLECDVWAGTIRCGGDDGSVEVWGGSVFMTGMQLDDSRANVESRQSVAGVAELSWGTSPRGEFCATVVHGRLNWQFCGADTPENRELVLRFSQGYTLTFPAVVVTRGNWTEGTGSWRKPSATATPLTYIYRASPRPYRD